MSEQIKAAEQAILDAKELIARRDMAVKLSNNREFRKLILEDYMVVESARLVAQSADPVLDDKQQKDALSMAQGAGHLKRYLSMMVVMGNTAEGQLADAEVYLDELRREELHVDEGSEG